MTKVINDQWEAYKLVPGSTFLDNRGYLCHVPSRFTLDITGKMFACRVDDYATIVILNGEYPVFPLVVMWEPDWEVNDEEFAQMEIDEDNGCPVGWRAMEIAAEEGVSSALLKGAL